MNECILDLMFGIPIETEGFVFVHDVHLKIFEKQVFMLHLELSVLTSAYGEG
jgi:hypothetical protein